MSPTRACRLARRAEIETDCWLGWRGWLLAVAIVTLSAIAPIVWGTAP